MFHLRPRRPLFASLFIILCFCLPPANLHAQCVGPVINTFPYNEGFESAAAWTTGGANNDWAWGAPTHATISAAGGGTNCWCVGGLTGSFYNFAEHSYIQSPCFDFTNLNYPWISLKIFWEEEYHYDGLQLESSIDGGTTWQTVGATTDPIDCKNANWYNYSGVTFLTGGTNSDGWSGRIGPTSGSCQGTGGSGGWVVATHCLTGLAKQPSVMFRFEFGSGTTCNSYDGIAIDDIHIQDNTGSGANFSFACAGPNTVNFTNTTGPCIGTSSWNFGDPASGVKNTSVLNNPSHTFSNSGTFTVTLTSAAPCSPAGIVSMPVTILGASITPTAITCNGSNNGSLTTTPSGGAGPYTYSWSPGGQTTASVNNLPPGTYSVTVSSSGTCSATTSATLAQPALLAATTSIIPASCGNNSGSIRVSPTGGTGAYTYSWSPSGGTTATASGLAPNTYTCTITDSKGCTASVSGTIVNVSTVPVASVHSTGPVIFCNGGSVMLYAGGAGTYSWSTGATSDTITVNSSGTYTVTVTNGCGSKAADTVVTVQTLPVAVITGKPVFCTGDSTILTASGGSSYSWNTGATTASIEVKSVGTYTVTAQNTCGTSQAQLVVKQSSVIANFLVDSLSGHAPLTIHTTNTSIGANSYSWVFGDGNTSTATNPTDVYTAGGSYTITLTANDTNGCSSSRTLIITVVNETSSVTVPNVFTPNGDGSNDTFLINAQNISQFDVKIYDRWGVMLSELAAPNQTWDGRTKTGTVVVNGTYYYVLDAKGVDGKQYKLNGFFMLLR
jgi:gliding motility-associated-like protein